MFAKSILSVIAGASLLVACGPSKMQIDPKNVANVVVRPASGQNLFCPGDKFQVEVVAKLKDGTNCSSINPDLGCMGKKDSIIDANILRVEATPGAPAGGPHPFVFVPDPNPLHTAATGMRLKAWIVGATGQQSDTAFAETVLKPVYQCQAMNTLGAPPPMGHGMHGGPGPALRVTATTLSTPFYPDAVLIRIDATELGLTRYVISQSADMIVRIASKGQDGARGFPGASGVAGARGSNASSTCGKGGRGQDGGPGGLGGPGGNGGPGGFVEVLMDSKASDKISARLRISSPGGAAGPGGWGGSGGPGGSGGSGGPSGAGCTGQSGENGNSGPAGPPGPSGIPGPSGPAPTFGTAPREKLFAGELGVIQQIEATPAPK